MLPAIFVFVVLFVWGDMKILGAHKCVASIVNASIQFNQKIIGIHYNLYNIFDVHVKLRTIVILFLIAQ